MTATSNDITNTPSVASAAVGVTVTTVSPSTTKLTLPAGQVTGGSDVVATVTVSSAAAAIAGHLVIRSGDTVVGSADVAGAAPSVTIEVTVTGLPVGELSLTATFEGSTAVAQSHSDPVELTVSFWDYAPTAPFFDDVMWLAEKGISTGYIDGSFHPGSPIDRQAMAAFLYRWKNTGVAPAACTVRPFADIAVRQQFCGEITWLKSQHVTNGFADGSYRAGASTDRQTMAAFLHRLSAQG